MAALAWVSWICLKTLPMPGRIRARASAAASRSRRLCAGCFLGVELVVHAEQYRALTLAGGNVAMACLPTMDVMPPAVRLAIVGCGDVLYRHYLPALEALAGQVVIDAFVDPRPGAAEQAATSVAGWSPDARSVPDLEALLAADRRSTRRSTCRRRRPMPR